MGITAGIKEVFTVSQECYAKLPKKKTVPGRSNQTEYSEQTALALETANLSKTRDPQKEL